MKIPYKKYLYGKEAREQLLEGVNILARSVACTLGGKGRNVIFESEIFQRPQITNDGVTIAREGNLEDPVHNLAMQLIKQASFRTNEVAGDGTTSSIVIAQKIIEEAYKVIDKGVNAVGLRKELEKTANYLVSRLNGARRDVQDVRELCSIAHISSQDEALGKLIGEAMFDIGKDGSVTLEEGVKHGVFVEKINGMRLDHGIKEGILTDQGKHECKMEAVRVLVSMDPLDDLHKQFQPFIRQFVDSREEDGMVTKVHCDKFMIIAESISQDILQFLFANTKTSANPNAPFTWAWVQPPSWGTKREEMMKDICAFVGAKLVDKSQGIYLKDVKLEDMGFASRVIAQKTHTIIIPENLESGKTRLEELQKYKDHVEGEHELKDINQRIASLNGSIAIVKFNAPTDADKKELKYRLEDAVHAAKSTLEEGYLPGGGVALLNASSDIDGPGPKTEEGKLAEKIMVAACEAPIRQILLNAGYENIDEVVSKLKGAKGQGINVLTDETVDMITAGIIDPLKVVKHSLMNAVSAAGILVTTECAITNVPEKEETKSQQ